MPNQAEIICDMKDAAAEWGNPVFTWRGSEYGFLPSNDVFEKRSLGQRGGGFDEAITLTIDTWSDQFTSGLPISQDPDLLTYRSRQYSIMLVQKIDPTGAILHIECVSPNR